MKKLTETMLVRACLDYLALRGVFAFRTNSGAVHAEYKGKHRFVRFSSAKGLSDIIGVIPGRAGRCGGWFLSVECKIGNRKLTDDQMDFANRVTKAGGLALTVRDSVDDLDRQIRPFLTDKNE